MALWHSVLAWLCASKPVHVVKCACVHLASGSTLWDCCTASCVLLMPMASCVLRVLVYAAGGSKGRALVSVSDKTGLDELAKVC
jgi:hypothetical protein